MQSYYSSIGYLPICIFINLNLVTHFYFIPHKQDTNCIMNENRNLMIYIGREHIARICSGIYSRVICIRTTRGESRISERGEYTLTILIFFNVAIGNFCDFYRLIFRTLKKSRFTRRHHITQPHNHGIYHYKSYI